MDNVLPVATISPVPMADPIAVGLVNMGSEGTRNHEPITLIRRGVKAS